MTEKEAVPVVAAAAADVPVNVTDGGAAEGSPNVKPELGNCGSGEGSEETIPQQTPDGKKKRKRRRRGKGKKNQPTEEASLEDTSPFPDASPPTPVNGLLEGSLSEQKLQTPQKSGEKKNKGKEQAKTQSCQETPAENGSQEGWEEVISDSVEGGKRRKQRHRNRPKSAPTSREELTKSSQQSQLSLQAQPSDKPDATQCTLPSVQAKDSQPDKPDAAQCTPPSVRRKDAQPDKPDTTQCTPPSVRRKDQQQRTPKTPKNQQSRQSGPNTPQQSSSKRRNRNRGTPRTPGTPQQGGKQNFKPFEDYWTFEDVSHGLKREELQRGTIRINQKNFEEAYLDNPIGGADIMIFGVTARNRALPGDVVAVQLLPKSEWKVLIKDYEVHLANQDSNSEASKAPKEGESANDITEHLQKLNINSSSPSKEVSDDLKEGLRENHEKELQDLEKTVKKLFADDILEDVPGAAGSARDNAESRGDEKAVIPDRFYQRTAKVVYIIEKRHSRACVGNLKKPGSQKATDAMFSPADSRLPRIHIPLTECPDGFTERPQDFADTLFIARINNWPQHSPFAKGHLHRSLGEAGEIEPETEGILIEHGIDYSEFKQEVLDCLPTDLPWQIPKEEFARRRDFRKECIFTIDPATARDLDDALHCKALGNNEYEVGVHIADVSFFVHEDTALDNIAGQRATSVYLVQKVIPMLPRLLCEQLCSLNPDEDRLTFSIIWKITEDGEILDEWCGRSVIRSCVKMSYDHAQDIIENPDKQFSSEELPPISNGFEIPTIMESVVNLNKIAVNLRKKRFDGGALRLDQVKLQFTLNHETGLPSGYSVYQQRDSNRLVEEFMLLANMAVAHRICKAFGDTALLRRHPPPKSKMMDDLIDLCYELGIDIEGSTSGKLQSSLKKYVGEDQYTKGINQILTVLISKPMKRALYFCTGTFTDEEIYRHYALNVPFYTHFTSPIRRYADVIVHRLLAASLKCGPRPTRDQESTQEQADWCNNRKDNAKRVQELSSEMFFAIFVKECGPLEEEGMVMQILDRAADVLILNLGVTVRVYRDPLPLKNFRFSKVKRQGILTLTWRADDSHPEIVQTIKMFSQVKVKLQAGKRRLKYEAILQRPEEGDDQEDET